MAAVPLFSPKQSIGKLAALHRAHVKIGRPDLVSPSRAHDVAIPWGLAGAIGLIVAIECFVTRNWLDFTDPVSLSWRHSARAAETRSPGCDLLCLGDSLIKHSLVPGVIEKRTGLHAVNLSAARAPALLTYFLLRRAVGAGARPAAIIINAKPAVLLADPGFNERYWREVISPRECLDVLQMTHNGPFLLSTLVGRLLPSLRSRLEVRSNVLAALRGETAPIQSINRVLLRNWTKNGGANIAAARSHPRQVDAPDVAHRLHPGVFHVDPTNAAGIERLLRLAAEHDIPVYWVLTPLLPALQALRDQSGAETAYERFVRSFLARYPRHLTVLDARRAGYPSALFVDETHLNGPGAIALSRSVAMAIALERSGRNSQTAPGWIALGFPTDNPTESANAVEDLDQSKEWLNRPPTASVSYSATTNPSALISRPLLRPCTPMTNLPSPETVAEPPPRGSPSQLDK